jgi:hypothetical protein
MRPNDNRPQRNPGRNPFEGNDSPPLIDLRFRNGIVVRCIDPRKYRWKQWPEGPHDFDIASWKVSESKSYEVVWPVDEKVGNPNLKSNSSTKSAA